MCNDNFGHKRRLVSVFSLQTNTTKEWSLKRDVQSSMASEMFYLGQKVVFLKKCRIHFDELGLDSLYYFVSNAEILKNSLL